MPDLPISEPAETTIEEPPGSLEAVAAAGSDRARLMAVSAAFPACLAAWAALGQAALGAGESVAAYAYFRVGYHRGLDRIRGAGWRGGGRVPWSHEPNRGFLRSVGGLGRAAAALDESDEAERCRAFLAQLAPDAPETIR